MIKGASWNLLFLILAAPVGYFVRILYANSLTKVEVGLFYAIFDLICMIAIFRGLGLNSALVYFIPKFLVQKRKDMVKSTIIMVLLIQTSVAVLIALVMYSMLPLIIKYYINNQNQFGDFAVIPPIFIIMIFGYYIFDGIKSVVFNTFQGFQSQKIYGTCNFLNMSCILILSIIFTYFSFGVYSPAVSYTITSILMVLLYGILLVIKIFPEFFNEKFNFSKKLLKDIFTYSMPVMFGSTSFVIMGYLDSACLTYFTGLDAVADYRNVAMPTATILSYFAGSICTVLLPMATEMWERGERKNLSKGIKRILVYSFTISIPFSVLLAYFSTALVNLFFNENYLSAAIPISILSFGIIFLSMNNIIFNVFNGIGRPKLSAKILYFGALFNTIFNILLIPRYGTIGAACTTSLSYMLIHFIQIIYINKILGHTYPLKEFIVCIISSILAIIPLCSINYGFTSPFLKIMVLGAIYISTYLILYYGLNAVFFKKYNGSS